MTLQDVKNRFEIIGNSPLLNIALETANKVAPTEMTVLINGESGVGKENFSKIIHHLSQRRLGPFIAVNCGAIPEGTIDSELFGHEKGAFTGAHDTRKGYFETVNGGTIFLDEIGELPLETQARLLRVLETGEFIKVGSSKVQKTDVRVIAATNKDLLDLTAREKFREDLYYRLSTVPIKVPPLRERGQDIVLLFRKFAQDFSEKYHTQPVSLDESGKVRLMEYRWPGNIRQLKNVTEQLCVLEPERLINANVLNTYLPAAPVGLPVPVGNAGSGNPSMSERDIFYKVLFDLRKDMNDLKSVVFGMIQGENISPDTLSPVFDTTQPVIQHPQVYNPPAPVYTPAPIAPMIIQPMDEHEEIKEKDEILSLEKKELELIRRALDKHKGRRRKAARELGISERTLYRKIRQYDLE